MFHYLDLWLYKTESIQFKRERYKISSVVYQRESKMEVKGKNVFITGASKGIGKSVAEALLVKKAKVNIYDMCK